MPNSRFGRKAGNTPITDYDNSRLSPGQRLRVVTRDSGPESPESLAISAMLAHGQFTPVRWGLSVDDLSCWERLWAFCCDYQATSGCAPPVDLVTRSFPDFEFTAEVNIDWAAGLLRRAAKGRDLRRRMGRAIVALNDEDVDEAYDAFDGLTRPRGKNRSGMSVLDVVTVVDELDITRIPVPWEACGRATGGIGPAELWYVAARPGQGKTWAGIRFGVTAAKAGARVRYISMEMRSRTISRRAQTVLAGRDAGLQRLLRSDSPGERKDGLDALAARLPGSFEVIDTSHGRVTIATVGDAMAESDLVIVDHVGLMSTSSGQRAIEDWRVMATISNQLKEETLITQVPVLALSQINREGDTGGIRPPRLSQLAQSDALAQDGDVILTMRKIHAHVQSWSAEKVREGHELRWFTDFRPEHGKMGEISKDRALEISAESEEADLL